MGGRALKNTFTRRYNRDEFEVIKDEVLTLIMKAGFTNAVIPLFYRKKETFGDLDVLVQVEGSEPLREIITNVFKPNEIFHNGNCWSFDYKEFQVDFITTPAEHFHSNFMYLSYNDLGNMIGRLAHPFGLKYGQEGLWYEYYNCKKHNLGEIPISKDYPEIFKFLGLDFARWEQGFDELEDIFAYVASSKYFDWRQYQMDTLNHINRERNLKRKSYMTLLEWIDSNNVKQEYDFESDKTKYIRTINSAFPKSNLLTEIRRLEYENAQRLYIQSKFNGHKITAMFGLEGPELGKAIVEFKEYILARRGPLYGGKPITFNSWVLETPEGEIWSFFNVYLVSYRSSFPSA